MVGPRSPVRTQVRRSAASSFPADVDAASVPRIVGRGGPPRSRLPRLDSSRKSGKLRRDRRDSFERRKSEREIGISPSGDKARTDPLDVTWLSREYTHVRMIARDGTPQFCTRRNKHLCVEECDGRVIRMIYITARQCHLELATCQ